MRERRAFANRSGWSKTMSKYSEYEYRKQPGFDMNTFKGAHKPSR